MHLPAASALLGSALLVAGAAIPETNTTAPPVPTEKIPKPKLIIKPEQLLADLTSKGLALLNGTLLTDKHRASNGGRNNQI